MADDEDDLLLSALENFEQTQLGQSSQPAPFTTAPQPDDNAYGYQQTDNAAGEALTKRKEQEPNSDDTPSCLCGLPTVLLTSQTQRNPGRNYFKCPKPREEQCNYFMWADELDNPSAKKRAYTNPNATTPPPSNSNQRPPQPSSNSSVPDYFGRFGGPSPAPLPGASAAGPTASGQVLCECGVPALMLTSRTTKNPDRQFYKCENKDRPCKYFAWADELGPGGGAPQSNTQKTGGYQSYNSSTYNNNSYSNNNSSYNNSNYNQNGPGPGGGNAGQSSFTPPGKAEYGGAGGGGANLDKSGDVCFKCNQPGHWASNCPNAAMGGSGGGGGGGDPSRSGDVCFKCNQPGHWASNCPNAAVGGSGGGGGGKGNCYICNGEGHWASECPQKQAGGGYGGGRGYGGGGGGGGGYGGGNRTFGGGGGSSDKPCYNCGQTGHWASSCPSKKAGGGGGSWAGKGRGTW